MIKELFIDILIPISLTAFGSVLLSSTIKNKYLKLATSFILGHGLFSFLLFLLSLLIKIHITQILVIFLLTYLIFFWQHRLSIVSFMKNPKRILPSERPKLSTIVPLTILLLVLLPHLYNT